MSRSRCKSVPAALSKGRIIVTSGAGHQRLRGRRDHDERRQPVKRRVRDDTRPDAVRLAVQIPQHHGEKKSGISVGPYSRCTSTKIKELSTMGMADGLAAAVC